MWFGLDIETECKTTERTRPLLYFRLTETSDEKWRVEPTGH